MAIDYCYSPNYDLPLSPLGPTLSKQEAYTEYIKKNEDRLSELPSTKRLSQSKPQIEKLFFELAAKWERDTRTVSSTSDIVANHYYQQIIRLGWEVVPFLLRDLPVSRRFWFPALHQITKVRPFDIKDAGNRKRMMEAWSLWGRRKGLI